MVALRTLLLLPLLLLLLLPLRTVVLPACLRACVRRHCSLI